MENDLRRAHANRDIVVIFIHIGRKESGLEMS